MPPIPLIPFQQSVTRLTTSKQVEELSCVIKHRNEVALKIEFLEVSVNTSKGSAFKSIRQILCRTQNITDLVLRLSFKPVCILPSTVVLNRLTSLSVNIPHSVVAQLLQNHSHIENLVLGPCGNTLRCPLTTCSLPSLERLTCPPSCVRAVTQSSPVHWLAATYDGVLHAHFPILQLLDFYPIQTSSVLTTLHVDFDHTAERLLLRISAAAPALVCLKLTESSSSEVLYLLCGIACANVMRTSLRSHRCHGMIRRVGKPGCGPFHPLRGYCYDRGTSSGKQLTWRMHLSFTGSISPRGSAM